jgi:hypothetical protein
MLHGWVGMGSVWGAGGGEAGGLGHLSHRLAARIVNMAPVGITGGRWCCTGGGPGPRGGGGQGWFDLLCGVLNIA